jgi:hypothetical protein
MRRRVRLPAVMRFDDLGRRAEVDLDRHQVNLGEGLDSETKGKFAEPGVEATAGPSVEGGRRTTGAGRGRR